MRLSTWILLSLVICAAVWMYPAGPRVEQSADIFHSTFYQIMKLTGAW